MSYKLSGSAGSQALRSAVTSALPSTFPLCVALWATFGAGDQCAVDLDDDGSGNQNRVQIGYSSATPVFNFVIKAANTTKNSTITGFAADLLVNEWVFMCFKVLSTTNRPSFVGRRGTLYEGNNTDNVAQFPAIDRVTMGYLPFFGDLADHQGHLGKVGIWNLDLPITAIRRMAAGEPFINFRTGMVDMWELDGRIVSETVPSLYRKLDLTVTGLPAYSLNNPPVIYPKRRPVWRVPAAGNTVSPGVVSHSYSAQAPKASASVAPGEAAHTYTALAPKVSASVAPGDVTHIYTAQAPQLRASVMPAQVTHAYSAETPVVTVGASVQPGAVVHTYSGIAPKASASVAPAEAAHSYSAAAPNASAGNSIAPPEVTHTYTGQAPKLSAAVAPDEVMHSYAGETPQARTSIDPGVTTHDYAAESPAVHLRVEAPFVTHVYTAELADASGIIGQPTPGRTHYARAIQRLHEARARIHYARARPREK